MLRPVIFIGCGGSGEKAVRYVRAAVQRRLDQSDWQQPMPDSWQFIGVDTLTTQENPAEIPTIPVEDFLTLSSEHDTYAALHRSLEAEHSGHRGDPELLCGWLPEPNQVRIPIKDGAGQNRAIGRATALRSLERTLEPRLSEAFRRAKAGNQELYEVGRCLGVDAELGSETPQPLVVVCSSMAGGTGAGVALDVVDLLRRCDPLGKYPSLVIFANDIFDFEGKKQPMAANSLGLLSELLAAYWSEPGEIESPLSTNNVQDAGVGPHSVFVLGKSGYSGGDLGSTAEFYQAAGEALSSWVTSSTVQEKIHNFINVNWLNNAKGNFGGFPFGKERQFGAVSAFGAAKVTVGRERFAQWAQHQLGKEVLESLLRGHRRLHPQASSAQQKSDEEVVQKLGKDYAGMVYAGSPGWEPPPGRLPGCQGAGDQYGSDEQLREKAGEVKRRLKQALGSGQTGTGQQWFNRLQQLSLQEKQEIERLASTTSPEDRQWCQNMVDATCKAASQIAAVASLPVAATALTEAAEQLNSAEITTTKARAKQAGSSSSDRATKGLEMMRLAEGKFGPDNSKLDEALTLMAQSVALRWQELRLAKAAEVLEHATTQVLGAIEDELRAAAGQVGAALASDEVTLWPEHGRVPPRYRPSTVEFPLESHDVWTQNLGELCSEAKIPGIPCGTRSTDPLRYRLIAGTSLLADENYIVPLVYRTHMGWTPGQAANLACNADTDEIVERVSSWTNDPGGKFKSFLDEGLEQYLSENDPDTDKRRIDRTARLARFRQQLGKAKTRSDPLVSIDSDLYGQCHEDRLEFLTVCSQFPFAADHPAGQDALKIVGEKAYNFSNTDTTSVVISRYIASPIHPLVVRSITTPLSDALADTEDPGERSSSFWMWRRARRLDGFVPLPRAVLEAIIRGFAVARLCGYITADGERPIRITAGPDEVEFPWPLLSRSAPNDILALLLEGFSLTFGMVGGSGFRVYEGYKRLYELGEPAERGLIHRDLEALLATGAVPHPTVAAEMPKAHGATREERERAARNYLEANEDWFLSKKTERGKRVLFHRSADGRAGPGVPTMELADLLLKCYSELNNLLKTEETRGSVV